MIFQFFCLVKKILDFDVPLLQRIDIIVLGSIVMETVIFIHAFELNWKNLLTIEFFFWQKRIKLKEIVKLKLNCD